MTTKFRAYAKSRLLPFYGYYVQNYEGQGFITSVDGTDTAPVESETVAPFTTRYDKNGQEIYLGDINQDGGVVIWNEDDASFCWAYEGIETQPMGEEEDWCEIITNIYK